MPLGAFKAALMGTAGVSTADVVLLSDQDASNSASLSFTSDITSTYGEYIFRFYNINPATDRTRLCFQVNATDGADYDDSLITSSAFCTTVYEDESYSPNLSYRAGDDLAQSASFQRLSGEANNDADSIMAGELHLFNPASTTYVKHFYATVNTNCDGGDDDPFFNNHYVAGYINDTTAIDDIQFKMESGNFDGTIKMWGVKKNGNDTDNN